MGLPLTHQRINDPLWIECIARINDAGSMGERREVT
jgi:hypothetical protein